MLLWFAVNFAFALPTHPSGGSTIIYPIIHAVVRYSIVDDASGTVVNSVDQSIIGQGSASDGAGSGFDLPAILWLSFGLAAGLYLTLGGIRLWRMTTALAIGMVFALCGQLLSGDPRLSNQCNLQPICSLGGDYKCRQCNRRVGYPPDGHHIKLLHARVPWRSFQVLWPGRNACLEHPRRDVGRNAIGSDARGAAFATLSSELDHYRGVCGGWVRGHSVQATNRHSECRFLERPL